MRHLIPALLSIVLLVPPIVTAQKPVFEVASVKPNTSGNGFMDITPGRFVATGVPLRMLLREAYGLRDAQLVGGPTWINADPWDVEGRSPAGQTDVRLVTEMAQSLIEERFQLQSHREVRDLSVYELTVLKGGLKMKESLDSSPHGRMGRGSIDGTGFSIAILVKVLAQGLDRPVIDKTGLTRMYDIKLQWSAEVSRGEGPASDQPGLFTAIQEQLGLKLEAAKAPIEVMVIDHVERPSEN